MMDNAKLSCRQVVKLIIKGPWEIGKYQNYN